LKAALPPSARCQASRKRRFSGVAGALIAFKRSLSQLVKVATNASFATVAAAMEPMFTERIPNGEPRLTWGESLIGWIAYALVGLLAVAAVLSVFIG
jgi:hypothetical protein